jgi:hypothetical protein
MEQLASSHPSESVSQLQSLGVSIDHGQPARAVAISVDLIVIVRKTRGQGCTEKDLLVG